MKRNLLAVISIVLTVVALNSCTSDSGLEPDRGKQYITEFNVGRSSINSEAETKTQFDVDNGRGVYWDKNDKLIFVKKDNNGAYAYADNPSDCLKGFVCTDGDGSESSSSSTFGLMTNYTDGLEIGQQYYAYYYPEYSYVPESVGFPTNKDEAIAINNFTQYGQDEESIIEFLREYDWLQLKGGEAITVNDQMEVDMEHIFAFIKVNINWNGAPDDWNGQADFPFACVKVGSDDANPFMTAFYMDGYGKWTAVSGDYVETKRNAVNEGNALCIGSENSVITYFLLVKSLNPVSNFWVKVYGSNYPNVTTDYYSKTIKFTLKDNKKITFKPGKQYTIDLNCDFRNMQANTADEWQNKGDLSVCNPEDWKNMEITYPY